MALGYQFKRKKKETNLRKITAKFIFCYKIRLNLDKFLDKKKNSF